MFELQEERTQQIAITKKGIITMNDGVVKLIRTSVSKGTGLLLGRHGINSFLKEEPSLVCENRVVANELNCGTGYECADCI